MSQAVVKHVRTEYRLGEGKTREAVAISHHDSKRDAHMAVKGANARGNNKDDDVELHVDLISGKYMRVPKKSVQARRIQNREFNWQRDLRGARWVAPKGWSAVEDKVVIQRASASPRRTGVSRASLTKSVSGFGPPGTIAKTRMRARHSVSSARGPGKVIRRSPRRSVPGNPARRSYSMPRRRRPSNDSISSYSTGSSYTGSSYTRSTSGDSYDSRGYSDFEPDVDRGSPRRGKPSPRHRRRPSGGSLLETPSPPPSGDRNRDRDWITRYRITANELRQLFKAADMNNMLVAKLHEEFLSLEASMTKENASSVYQQFLFIASMLQLLHGRGNGGASASGQLESTVYYPLPFGKEPGTAFHVKDGAITVGVEDELSRWVARLAIVRARLETAKLKLFADSSQEVSQEVRRAYQAAMDAVVEAEKGQATLMKDLRSNNGSAAAAAAGDGHARDPVAVARFAATVETADRRCDALSRAWLSAGYAVQFGPLYTSWSHGKSGASLSAHPGPHPPAASQGHSSNRTYTYTYTRKPRRKTRRTRGGGDGGYVVTTEEHVYGGAPTQSPRLRSRGSRISVVPSNVSLRVPHTPSAPVDQEYSRLRKDYTLHKQLAAHERSRADLLLASERRTHAQLMKLRSQKDLADQRSEEMAEILRRRMGRAMTDARRMQEEVSAAEEKLKLEAERLEAEKYTLNIRITQERERLQAEADAQRSKLDAEARRRLEEHERLMRRLQEELSRREREAEIRIKQTRLEAKEETERRAMEIERLKRELMEADRRRQEDHQRLLHEQSQATVRLRKEIADMEAGAEAERARLMREKMEAQKQLERELALLRRKLMDVESTKARETEQLSEMNRELEAKANADARLAAQLKAELELVDARKKAEEERMKRDLSEAEERARQQVEEALARSKADRQRLLAEREEAEAALQRRLKEIESKEMKSRAEAEEMRRQMEIRLRESERRLETEKSELNMKAAREAEVMKRKADEAALEVERLKKEHAKALEQARNQAALAASEEARRKAEAERAALEKQAELRVREMQEEMQRAAKEAEALRLQKKQLEEKAKQAEIERLERIRMEKEAEDRRIAHEAALKKQREEQERRDREMAALRIQSRTRGFLAQKEVERLRREKEAADAARAAEEERRRLAYERQLAEERARQEALARDKAAAEERLRRERAATQLQSQYRGHRERLRYQAMREDRAAASIQAAARGRLARRQAREMARLKAENEKQRAILAVAEAAANAEASARQQLRKRSHVDLAELDDEIRVAEEEMDRNSRAVRALQELSRTMELNGDTRNLLNQAQASLLNAQSALAEAKRKRYAMHGDEHGSDYQVIQARVDDGDHAAAHGASLSRADLQKIASRVDDSKVYTAGLHVHAREAASRVYHMSQMSMSAEWRLRQATMLQDAIDRLEAARSEYASVRQQNPHLDKMGVQIQFAVELAGMSIHLAEEFEDNIFSTGFEAFLVDFDMMGGQERWINSAMLEKFIMEVSRTVLIVDLMRVRVERHNQRIKEFYGGRVPMSAQRWAKLRNMFRLIGATQFKAAILKAHESGGASGGGGGGGASLKSAILRARDKSRRKSVTDWGGFAQYIRRKGTAQLHEALAHRSANSHTSGMQRSPSADAMLQRPRHRLYQRRQAVKIVDDLVKSMEPVNAVVDKDPALELGKHSSLFMSDYATLLNRLQRATTLFQSVLDELRKGYSSLPKSLGQPLQRLIVDAKQALDTASASFSSAEERTRRAPSDFEIRRVASTVDLTERKVWRVIAGLEHVKKELRVRNLRKETRARMRSMRKQTKSQLRDHKRTMSSASNASGAILEEGSSAGTPGRTGASFRHSRYSASSQVSVEESKDHATLGGGAAGVLWSPSGEASPSSAALVPSRPLGASSSGASTEGMVLKSAQRTHSFTRKSSHSRLSATSGEVDESKSPSKYSGGGAVNRSYETTTEVIKNDDGTMRVVTRRRSFTKRSNSGTNVTGAGADNASPDEMMAKFASSVPANAKVSMTSSSTATSTKTSTKLGPDGKPITTTTADREASSYRRAGDIKQADNGKLVFEGDENFNKKKDYVGTDGVRRNSKEAGANHFSREVGQAGPLRLK